MCMCAYMCVCVYVFSNEETLLTFPQSLVKNLIIFPPEQFLVLL